MELGLIYGVLHPNYEESGSLELNLDFSPAIIATAMIGGRTVLIFLHFWNIGNDNISSTRFNCCFGEIWYCLCSIIYAA